MLRGGFTRTTGQLARQAMLRCAFTRTTGELAKEATLLGGFTRTTGQLAQQATLRGAFTRTTGQLANKATLLGNFTRTTGQRDRDPSAHGNARTDLVNPVIQRLDAVEDLVQLIRHRGIGATPAGRLIQAAVRAGRDQPVADPGLQLVQPGDQVLFARGRRACRRSGGGAAQAPRRWPTRAARRSDRWESAWRQAKQVARPRHRRSIFP
jgi:hypothetical protein